MDKKQINCIHCQGKGCFNKILCPTCLGKKSLSKVEILNILNDPGKTEISDLEVPSKEIASENIDNKIKRDTEKENVTLFMTKEKENKNRVLEI